MSLFYRYLLVMGMAAFPILELRGAIPAGVAMDLPVHAVLTVSVIGNMIPVPFIIFFIKRIFVWMKKKSARLRHFAEKFEKRAAAKEGLLKKYELLGLFILVAIPLPGTGAWTGSLVAAMFDLRLKPAFAVIFLGVVVAGIIMSFISYGVSWLI